MLKILHLRIFVVLFKVNKSQWQCSHTDGCHHRGGRRWFRFVHIISERLVVGVGGRGGVHKNIFSMKYDGKK